jgi:hypothetical protein
VIIKAADGVTPLRYWDHTIDSRGRWLVSYGLGLSAGSFQPAVLRLNPNGTLDSSFASGGCRSFRRLARRNPRTSERHQRQHQCPGEKTPSRCGSSCTSTRRHCRSRRKPTTASSAVIHVSRATELRVLHAWPRSDGTIIAAGTSGAIGYALGAAAARGAPGLAAI